MAIFNPYVQQEIGRQKQEAQNRLFDTFFRVQQQKEMEEQRRVAEAKMEAQRAEKERLESLKVPNILRQNEMGIPLSAEQEAQLRAYDKQKGSELVFDPISGQQVPKYQPLSGGIVDERTAQGVQMQRELPQGVQGIVPADDYLSTPMDRDWELAGR